MIYQMTDIDRISLAIVGMILLTVSIFQLVYMIGLRIKGKLLFFSIIMTIAIFLLTQGIADLNGEETSWCFFICSQSVKTIWFWFSGIAVIQAAIRVSFLAAKQNMLTADSIRESLNALPDGICFSTLDGHPLLVNKQMHKISQQLFGDGMVNERYCYERLLARDFNEETIVLSAENQTVLQIQDFFWSFHRIRHGEIIETIAYDVSQQYRLNNELSANKQKLMEINARLKQYGQNVKAITREKEILAAKMRIHNYLGRFLLALRLKLEQSNEQEDNDLAVMWQYTVAALKNEIQREEDDDLEGLLQAASVLGIRICLNGDLPTEKNIREIILKAIFECMTNTARHALGDETQVQISSDQKIMCVITNNGIPPCKEIEETGGLANLRRTVELAGGIMEIQSSPEFRLTITFAHGKEEQ